MTERIFTQNNLLTIRRMAEEGRSATEIATAIGSTPAFGRFVFENTEFGLGSYYPVALTLAEWNINFAI